MNSTGREVGYARSGRVVALALLLTTGTPLAAQSIDLPARQPDARGGSVLSADLRTASLDEREAVVRGEVFLGNVPDWWRTFVPVRMTRTVAGREVTVCFAAAPDYLLVGSDDDWFLMPLRPETAQQIADATHTMLPTPAMVDAIWRTAAIRLGPDSIAPTAAMVTMPVFAAHNAMVRARRSASGMPPGSLVAGHKKDVVLTPRLDTLPGRVAIYGWHRPDGTPIQPLYTGHGSSHVDYSHGVRLVSRRMTIDGVAHDMLDVLQDSTVASALSDEGPMRSARYPTRLFPTRGGPDGPCGE